MDSSDPRFDEAIDLFNQREFFACHDVFEELWSETIGEDRAFLQGLIHAAVSLFHFSEGNLSGARKMHDSCLRYLSEYEENFQGVDLNRLRQELAVCFAELTAVNSGYPTGVTINHQLIPKLHRV